jgi:anti-sigma regulatory factor (Ser/Thr protein kinase)
MVDDMLDVSKIEAGLLGIWRRDVQLHDIIRHAMSMLQRKASVRGVTLEVVVPESLPTVCCDEEKVARVIVNLVTNGIKFCASDGVVRLWARSDEENREILVGVTDDGPGIPLEKQRAIFDRFSQLDTVQKQSTKGFGLGLAIAKELVHANLGELSIESIPGQGSTFTFTLPFAEPDKIFRQYLSRVTSLAQDAFELCFIRATAGDRVSKKEADDLDVFLGHNIRRNDIVIRASDLTWVVVLFVPKMEHADSIDRIERAHAELSRNRPFGPLPSLEWDVQGTWSVDTPPQMLLEQFDRCFSSRETCHV